MRRATAWYLFVGEGRNKADRAVQTIFKPTSYLGKMDDKSSSDQSAKATTTPPLPFDVRLIPEYDGTTHVVEWLTRASMLCDLRGVAIADVLPLRLTGGAFVVWSQLPDTSRSSLENVRDALYAAFALDQHSAYEAFTARRLRPSESADVYLADLRRLSAIFAGISERELACAFVAGLPDETRRTIRAGSIAENLDLSSVLARARAVLSDERVAAAGAPTSRVQPLRGQQRPQRCWTCGKPGHLAAVCQSSGSYVGGDASAPASSPSNE